MEIVIDNIEQFKNFFDVIYESSSDSLELRLFPDRMVCGVLDRSRTRFFHAEFKEDFFDVYTIDDLESVVINIDDINLLLNTCNKTDTLSLEINDPYMVAKISSENGNSRVFEFVLPTDTVDTPSTPHLDLPFEFKCDISNIKQSVDDITKITNIAGQDLFVFNIINKELNITTSDDTNTKYVNIIPVTFEKESDENVASQFTLEFIKQMTKLNKISKEVTIKLGNDMPMFFTFEDALMSVKISGLVAPRISEEE